MPNKNELNESTEIGMSKTIKRTWTTRKMELLSSLGLCEIIFSNDGGDRGERVVLTDGALTTTAGKDDA